MVAHQTIFLGGTVGSAIALPGIAMTLPVHLGRVLDQLRDPLQEARRRAAVDQAMVEGEAQPQLLRIAT